MSSKEDGRFKVCVWHDFHVGESTANILKSI